MCKSLLAAREAARGRVIVFANRLPPDWRLRKAVETKTVRTKKHWWGQPVIRPLHVVSCVELFVLPEPLLCREIFLLKHGVVRSHIL